MKRARTDSDAPDAPSAKNPAPSAFNESDRNYFDSYSDLGIHETMLRDAARTLAYKNAIIACKPQIEGKVVLDVGGGTGILSIFAAKDGGAKKVYCVDASDIHKQARLVVEANGLTDVIQVINGRIEEIELPEKVDVIVSEWMGYFLIFESMLDSVIVARDKWLKPGGLILPSHAMLYLSTFYFEDQFDSRVNFWNQVKEQYGVDMSPLAPIAKHQLLKELQIDFAPQESVLGAPAVILDLDLSNTTPEQLKSFRSPFSCNTELYGSLHGFVSWFDVTFTTPTGPLVLSTSPSAIDTHWKQVLIWVAETPVLVQDQVVSGTIAVSKNQENPRFIDIELTYETKGMAQAATHGYTISDSPYSTSHPDKDKSK